MVKSRKRVCLFCNHEWTAKSPESGLQCPVCKRYIKAHDREKSSENAIKKYYIEKGYQIRKSQKDGKPDIIARRKKGRKPFDISLRPNQAQLIQLEKAYRRGRKQILCFVVGKKILFFRLFRIYNTKEKKDI